MSSVRARVVRWVSDEPQPGLIDVALMDAHGRDWRFIDKVAIFTTEVLTAGTTLPIDIDLSVVVHGRRELPDGSAIVRVSTVPSWGLQTVDGVSEFDLPTECVVET